jgi:aconitate hydratase
LAGTVDIDLSSEPLGTGKDGPVYLKDIWPTAQEVADLVEASLNKGMFEERYANVFEGSKMWKDIKVTGDELFQWDDSSTYIHHPPFFQELTLDVPSIKNIQNARVLALLGDSITTDHISPAGNIAMDSPAGKFLQGCGIQPRDFNSYGARRGNDLVMSRGTFANIRMKNLLVGGKEGWYTRYFGVSGKEIVAGETTIFDAATKYQAQGIPTIVIAGKEYGTGSSRDWAAKGPMLLGVKAVIAESFERIHRSNLVGMGVLPLRFLEGQNAESLGLDGTEVYNIEGLSDKMPPKSGVTVTARKANGSVVAFKAVVQLNTPVEVNYYRNGGILHTVLRNLVK